MKLSPFQREVLMRAVQGVDRQLPERYHPGPPPFVQLARRWFVPPGHLVPDGHEYRACRLLTARGLMKSTYLPPSPEHKVGIGTYAITAKGRSILKRAMEG